MLNKKCLTTLGLLSLTLLLGFISLHIMELFTVSKWVGISIASGIFIVMLILAIILRKRKYISYIVIPMNGLANGIAASSLFVYLNNFPEYWQTALLFITLCVLFYVYCLLAKFSFLQSHFVICIGLYILILFAIGIICLIVVGGPIFALALLCLIPFIAYLLLLVSKVKNFSELMKFGAYSSFAVLALIVFAVLIVISEGEALDGFDGGLDGGFDVGGKQKKNPYDYFAPLK